MVVIPDRYPNAASAIDILLSLMSVLVGCVAYAPAADAPATYDREISECDRFNRVCDSSSVRNTLPPLATDMY